VGRRGRKGGRRVGGWWWFPEARLRLAAMGDAAARGAWRGALAGQAVLGLRLSAAVAAAAMVVAVPAALLHFLGSEWAFVRFGRGVMALSAFFDERYVHREPYIVAFNRTMAEQRLRYFAAIAPNTLSTALFFICSYGSYLGGSGRVIVVMTAPVALIVAGALVGIQLGLDSTLVINLAMYSFFGSTIASTYVLTPRDSKIARQVAKQLLVYQLGFMIVQLPSNESSVRALDESEPRGALGFGSLARCRRFCDDVAGRPAGRPDNPTDLSLTDRPTNRADASPFTPQDSERFVQTFVLINAYREIGRYFMVSSAYHLNVANVAGQGLVVNRDAAMVPLLFFMTFIATTFRLEIANFDDQAFATASVALQAVYEVVMRLTASERDMRIKQTWHSCCRSSRQWRQTTLVVRGSSTVAPASAGSAGSAGSEGGSALDQPTSSGKLTRERLAAIHERKDIIRSFISRAIVVEMAAEYAGKCRSAEPGPAGACARQSRLSSARWAQLGLPLTLGRARDDNRHAHRHCSAGTRLEERDAVPVQGVPQTAAPVRQRCDGGLWRSAVHHGAADRG
jgi:hypothetical protein